MHLEETEIETFTHFNSDLIITSKCRVFSYSQQSERKSNDKPWMNQPSCMEDTSLVGEEQVNWEIFAQYSENPFRNYKKRSVLGAGF